MAKRSLIGHPKFDRFQMRLRLTRYEAVGVLETLWHMVGRFAPQGDIGKYEDEEIEAWIGWTGEPGALVAALVACRFLDESEKHRLVVHDWHDHIDNTTKTALRRAHLETVSHELTDFEPKPQLCHNTVETSLTTSVTVLTPPEPEPEPAPAPYILSPDASTGAESAKGFEDGSTPSKETEPAWYENPEYPNKPVQRVAQRIASTKVRSQSKPYPYRDVTEAQARKALEYLADCPDAESEELFWGSWDDYHDKKTKGQYTRYDQAIGNWAAKRKGEWATARRLQGNKPRATDYERPPVWTPGGAA